MSREEEQLEDLVQFGAETRQFLTSPIGCYLLDRSKEEIDAAVEELKRISPIDRDRIRTLQNIIIRAESVEQWLGEIIQAGSDARNLLDGEE